MISWKEFQAERIDEMAIAQRGNLKDYGEFLTTYKLNVVNDFMKLIDKNIRIDKLNYAKI